MSVFGQIVVIHAIFHIVLFVVFEAVDKLCSIAFVFAVVDLVVVVGVASVSILVYLFDMICDDAVFLVVVFIAFIFADGCVSFLFLARSSCTGKISTG